MVDRAAAAQIGGRLRSLRLQRGLSQDALAGLSGLSKSFISMVENGHRLLDRSQDITALADALLVAPSELIGQAVAAPHPAGAHDAVPALRLALMGLPRPGGAEVAPVETLAAEVAAANRLYHACEFAELARRLPELLQVLHRAAEDARGTARRPQLLRLLAQAYHPACTLLLKALGYTDLAFIAVTRATEVVTELDDPVYTALSGFFRTHVLMAAGDPSAALATAGAALADVDRRLSGAAPQHALLGELHLISATAAAQCRPGSSGAGVVAAHLREAERLAALTGETKAWHLNFGPTNVGIHQVSLSTDLGLHAQAAHAGREVDPMVIAAPGRQAAYYADLGRSLAHLRGHDAAAVAALVRAEAIAPERIRLNPLVCDAVRALLLRKLPVRTGRDLRGLAHRVGVAA